MRSAGAHAAVIVVATLIVAASVSSVPAFAQPHTVRAWDGRTLARVDPSLTARGILRPYAPADAVHVHDRALPANVVVDSVFRSLIDRMLRTSPTFRKQCARLGAAPHLRVSIQPVRQPLPSTARALTRFTTGGTGWIAAVELPGTTDAVELIAHELEHIVEQLDGVDLRALADRTASGVRHGRDGAFETIRAIRAGHIVAEEVRQGGR